MGYLIGVLTLCFVLGNGIRGTADLYIIMLGMFLANKILAKESV
jgi:hypothetical protein